MSKRRTWLWIIFGVCFLVILVGIGVIVGTTAWVQQNLEVTETTEAGAEQEFEGVRARFGGRPPLLELHDGRPAYTGGKLPEAPATAAPLNYLHVLVWDPDERKLASFVIPFWLLRLKTGPIEFSSYASGFDDNGVDLKIEDLEKLGPAIVFDTTSRDGERILVWTQ
jgi:hypothetical protein